MSTEAAGDCLEILVDRKGEPRVTDWKPQGRPFQFSVRKPMLWTAVWAVYLSAVRVASVPLSDAVQFTGYLIILLLIRITWGFDRGLKIALLSWAPIFIFGGEISILISCFTRTGPNNILLSQCWLAACAVNATGRRDRPSGSC